MAYAKKINRVGGTGARKITARKPRARKAVAQATRREVLDAKPEKLSREEFKRLHDDVTRRIPKTLSILAK